LRLRDGPFIQRGEKQASRQLAPAKGLFLKEVKFNESDFLSQNEEEQVLKQAEREMKECFKI